MPPLPPPTGTLIDVGGYRLHLQIAGTGTPAVIMDSGSGATSLMFDLVLPQVATFTTACAFDRAGYPWSDPAPPDMPRTSAQIVAELRIALQKAQIPPPYILVGLSFGGIDILTYAKQYPDEVAGLVFLDPSMPEMFERIPGVTSIKNWQRSMAVMARLSKWGWLRPFASFLVGAIVPKGKANLPPAVWQTHLAVGIHPDTMEAARREALVAQESFRGARVTKGELGDMPVQVLTAGEQWASGKMTPTKQAVLTLRQEMAEGSTRGEHHIVEGSGHIMSVDRPDVVIATIRKMVDEFHHNATKNDEK